MKIGERIKNRRIELGLSVDEVADKLGKNRATIYRYEKDDIKDLPITVLEPLAKVLETTPADLMGWSSETKRLSAYSEEFNKNFNNRNIGIKIKVYGRVAAGIPIEMIDDVVDEEEITQDMARRGTYIGIKIKGDSMTPNICDGDTVIVRLQEDAESGDTVIATVNGSDATCKRLRKYKDGIELISNNPSYPIMSYSNEEIANKPVRILGKVVELRRKF